MKIETEKFTISLYVKGDLASKKLILALPGKLDSKDYNHMKGLVDYFSERGYLAASMDPPGTWESGGGGSTYTLTSYIEAILEVLRYFGKKSILVGHSMGGSAAMFAIDSELVESLVFIMSPHRFDNLIKKVEGKESVRDLPNNPKKIRKYFLDKEFYLDAKKHNASLLLGKYTKPKLFIYGTEDVTITPASVRESFNISSEPKLLTKVDYHHDYRQDQDTINKVNGIIDSFIERYNS